MHRLSQRSTAIHESVTLAIAAEAKRMAAQGADVVSLSTGEPDFATPDVVKRAAIEAINANFTHYTQSEGIPTLREAIVDKFERDNGIRTDASRVIVSNGGKHSLHTILMAIVDSGDEVLIPAPYWTSYPDLVLLAGGRPVIVPTSAHRRYKIDPDVLDRHATAATRALIVNSPSNPTGVMYEQEELEAIGRWASARGCVVISDELYEKIVYGTNRHFSMGSMPEMEDLAVTINGVSKAYSMTGWRIGYMTGPKDMIAAAGRIQSQTTSNACSISQMAALSALTETSSDVAAMVRAFDARRNLAIGCAAGVPDINFPRPDGAFYLLIDVSRHLGSRAPDDVALARHLLVHHGVAVVPGSAFGAPGTLRLSYACADSVIVEGIARICRGVEELAV